MTFNLCPSWTGDLATWPARHASYRLPAMYGPSDPCPDWLADLIRQAAKASNAPTEWVLKTLAAVNARRVDDLNVERAISLFDVLYAKAAAVRASLSAGRDQTSEAATTVSRPTLPREVEPKDEDRAAA